VLRAALVTALGLAFAWTVPPTLTGVLSPRGAILLAVAAVAAALAAGAGGPSGSWGAVPTLRGSPPGSAAAS